jgi:fatty acid desaturase
VFSAGERLKHAWQRITRSPRAPLLTHACLLLLTALFFGLLLRLPFWAASVPCAILQHRIGVLLHEYIHGITFRRYRNNLRVLAVCDGLFLMFGSLELFRGTHLAHHRWLNTERDPAHQAATRSRRPGVGRVAALEAVHHAISFVEALRGRQPYVDPSRMLRGAIASTLVAAAWAAAGLPGMVLKIVALTVYNTLVPVSFRGAIEHHSRPGDPSFANEYRVLIPLFNLNKHVHHHEDPRCPWYRLEYRTERPLWTIHYLTHWFRVYLTRELVLMRPMPPGRSRSPRGRDRARPAAAGGQER